MSFDFNKNKYKKDISLQHVLNGSIKGALLQALAVTANSSK